MTDSAFLKWFEEQHGKRGSPPWTDEQLRQKVLDGRYAEAELRVRVVWDSRFQSALYAWNVTDADKRRKK